MRRLAATVSVAMLLLFASCASSEVLSSLTYRGQVIDEETGTPLPGAIVVFIWYLDVYSPVTKRIGEEFHMATEVRTDSYGYFEVSAAPGEQKRGASVVEVRRIDPIFFVPGYFLPYRVKTDGEAFRDPTVVVLKRARNPKAAIEPLPILPSFPFAHTPLLLKSLNQERARLGLPPIRPDK